MCRSIKKLRTEKPASDQEVYEAALQYVRKVSGYRVPAKRNEAAFTEAVEQVRAASRTLLESLNAR